MLLICSFPPSLSFLCPGSLAQSKGLKTLPPSVPRVLDGKRQRNFLEFGLHFPALGAHTWVSMYYWATFLPFFMTMAGLDWGSWEQSLPWHVRGNKWTHWEVWLVKSKEEKIRLHMKMARGSEQAAKDTHWNKWTTGYAKLEKLKLYLRSHWGTKEDNGKV